jgi:hypothetical protein
VHLLQKNISNRLLCPIERKNPSKKLNNKISQETYSVLKARKRKHLFGNDVTHKNKSRQEEHTQIHIVALKRFAHKMNSSHISFSSFIYFSTNTEWKADIKTVYMEKGRVGFKVFYLKSRTKRSEQEILCWLRGFRMISPKFGTYESWHNWRLCRADEKIDTYGEKFMHST